MKRPALIVLGVILPVIFYAQDSGKLVLAELHKSLTIEKTDKGKVDILRTISEYYRNQNPDTALFIAQQALNIAKAAKYEEGIMRSLFTKGKIYVSKGDYNTALEKYDSSLQISQDIGNILWICINSNYIGEVYELRSDHAQALVYFNAVIDLAKKNKNNKYINSEITACHNISRVYENISKLDSAKIYVDSSFQKLQREKDPNLYLFAKILNTMGSIAFKQGIFNTAMQYYDRSIPYANSAKDSQSISIAYLGKAKVFQARDQKDSSLFYAKQALFIARAKGFLKVVMDASGFLTEQFLRSVSDSALEIRKIYEAAKDSIFSQDKIREFLQTSFDNQLKQKEIEQANIKYRNNVRFLILIGGLAGLLFLAFVLWRNNRIKQKANQLLSAQKLEIDGQKLKVEASYRELKATQAQLIQSEKMASLGELTAGIAHEIQNPLNFVNNFSEVNKELLAEMKAEIDKGNLEEVKFLADDIIKNQEKINHHGKRAEGIVKGMLLHSRSSGGVKEPTDINALADEYLRLAYHGLRAKDKSFNATMKTDYDKSIGLIPVVPQDIGRVILNLITNAFYVVDEKKKSGPADYEPAVSVHTKKAGDKILLSVQDNGNGIPPKILDKIFQPFFTTKPTGQGTGLGLSLSYDIVKAHGGEIKVNTKENEGTEFTITLPA